MNRLQKEMKPGGALLMGVPAGIAVLDSKLSCGMGCDEATFTCEPDGTVSQAPSDSERTRNSDVETR